MEQIAFDILALFTGVCALGVVMSKNAVNGAMGLLLCLAGIAGLFIQLHAYLLAFILILVYGGAVVMLFLFIVMLLDMQGGQPWQRTKLRIFGFFVSAALLLCGLNLLMFRGRLPSGPAGPSTIGSSLDYYSYQLFTTYMLPTQVIGFLLLIAMLGVIVLSRRTPPTPES